MRKVMTMAVGLAVVSAVVAFAACGAWAGDTPAAGGATQVSCSASDLYACAKCGADLAKMHVLSCANGTVSLCSCEAGCKCTMKDDGAKCSCGKDVVKIAAKDIPGCGACKKAAPAPGAPLNEAK